MYIKEKMKSYNSFYNWFCNPEHICWIILFFGFIFRTIYAFQVSYNYSPHDLGVISSDEITSYGHLSYIQYLYLHKSIPNTNVGQFYHPPLFHIIGAIVLALNHVTENYEFAFENLQMLNMFFATVCVIYGYRILKLIGGKDKSLIMGTVFLSFCPSFYIIGAELNNDCLATLFQFMTIYYTLCWKNNQNINNIIKIALCIGFGMFTKTNGALIAFAVGLLFLYVFIKNKKSRIQYFLQYTIFGVICIPIGLGWNIFRYLKYDVPLSYIPKLSTDSNQYIGSLSALKRLGIPSVEQLTSYSIDWNNPIDFSNIWGQTFLTMNFDEGILHINGSIGEILAVLLLWSSILLWFSLICILFWNLLSKKVDFSLKIIFPVNFLIVFGFFVKFAFDYPHICTMNFRYIVISQLLLIACYIMYDSINLSRNIQIRCLNIFISIQSILTVILYLVYAV